MALARAQGIPVRFLIGFPVGAGKEGTVPGYRCWAEFWTGTVWAPVDASDAAKTKEPVKRVDGKAYGETKIRLEYRDL